MPKKQAPLEVLEKFLPPGAYEKVIYFLRHYKVHLTITRKRNSLLGDYRHRTHYQHHRISVNGNLNVYSFLITLLHELGHLLTFEEYGNQVPPHGQEWKMTYAALLQYFLSHKIFPADIEKEILKTLANPAASTCAEDRLIRVLKKYDLHPKNPKPLIEDIPFNALFRTEDGRIFQKGIQLRKRFKCREIKTGKEYLFSPVYEVEMLNGE